MSSLASRRTARLLLAGGVSALVLAGSPWNGGLTSSIGLIPAAHAQTGQTIELENIVVGGDSVTYRLPRVSVAGTNLSRADIEGLFAATATEPLSTRLARLDAERVTVPEFVVEQKFADSQQTTTYRNVVIEGIRGGRMATVSSEGGSFSGRTPDGKDSRGTFGRATMREVDTVTLTRVFAEPAGGAAEPLRQIYTGVSLADLKMTLDDGGEVSIGSVTGNDFKARPTPISWSETMKLMASLEKSKDKPQEEKTRAISAVIDLVEAFSIGNVEARDIRVVPKAGSTDGSASIRRMAFTGETAGRGGEFRIEDFAVTSPEARFTVAAVTSSGFSYKSTLEGMRKIGATIGAEPDPALLRELVPTLGTLRLEGLSGDVKTEESKERVQFSLRKFELTADKPINGVPTNLHLALDRAVFPVPADTENESLRTLAEIGVRTLDVSATLAATWTGGADELAIREITLQGENLGRVSIRGTLANVAKDVFDPDQAVAMVALLGATAKNLSVTIDNAGLFEKVLAHQAKEAGTKPEALRTQYAATASAGIPMVLGNTAHAKSLAQAVARFIAKPGTLVVEATTKDPAGLGMADFMAVSEPAEVLDKLDIRATAR